MRTIETTPLTLFSLFFLHQLWNFGIGYATPYLVDVGPGKAGLQSKVFFIWTATCACCAVFAFFCIVESSNLSLEEVDELYSSTTPMRSGRANAEVRARRSDLEAKGLSGVYAQGDEAATADENKNEVMATTGDTDADSKNSL